MSSSVRKDQEPSRAAVQSQRGTVIQSNSTSESARSERVRTSATVVYYLESARTTDTVEQHPEYRVETVLRLQQQ